MVDSISLHFYWTPPSENRRPKKFFILFRYLKSEILRNYPNVKGKNKPQQTWIYRIHRREEKQRLETRDYCP